MRQKPFVWIAVLMLISWAGHAKEVKLTSPNEQYVMTINDKGGLLHYTLDWCGQRIINSSRLGIDFGLDWHEKLQLGGVQNVEYRSDWHPVWGERSTIRDHYRFWKVDIMRSDIQQSMLSLEVRMYNEGVAFRYDFTYKWLLDVIKEYSEFAMPHGTMAWYTPDAEETFDYVPLTGWKSEAERPLLMRLPDEKGYVCLSEANLIDYVRTRFTLSDTKPETLVASPYGKFEGVAPYESPWRVIMYAQTPGNLLENSYLFYNLCPPSKIEDTSWIKPGKVMRETSLSTEGGLALVDFAVKHNLQYIHFDAGWYGKEDERSSDATVVTVPNLDIQKVTAYAKSKGIGVMLYINQRAIQQQLDELLPLYKSWGIAGLKFGFVRVGSQVWTKWLHEAVKKCADYGMIVDIHDEYRPTGVSRTYPNLLTQEGIYGNEHFPDAKHNTTLPFTRFIVGPADYTFSYYCRNWNEWEKGELNTKGMLRVTPAHQLALPAVFFSPLQFMYWYDTPKSSQDEPELKFWDDIYTVWDDSKVLHGEVGEYITVARRHGEEWFLGSITNNDARQLDVDLSFLPVGQEYIAEVYTDGDKSIKTRTRVKCTQYRVNSQTTMHFQLLPSGGAAMRLIPISMDPQNKAKSYKKETL